MFLFCFRGVIDAEDQFMSTAILAAMRSRDPKFQVGACIVNKDNVIVGIGYNGMPGGRDDAFSWGKDKNEYG
ncbi:unnamed protein product [Psylliodes chrysocephalus]|uniref:dCMP deaminase n=1 Tax=Psylliodes chrysocephalus TaxID=3402493 RepID=A0A9P0GD93_9CUCU|nr:unnamed protein product [Psylliodes chrysocephala]